MKVFDLQCTAHHQFEGWFASEADYHDQLGRGLIECPICGDKTVQKLPSAPRLNLGAAEPRQATGPATAQAAGLTSAPTAVQTQAAAMPDARALQAAYLQFARRMVEQTEDVGERFAEEARRIHYGESEERGIRGQASRQQTQELLDEGIPVLPLPLPDGLKGPLQ
jgi:hypothetical protein